MNEGQFREVLAERDRLIDKLILSHLKTLVGKHGLLSQSEIMEAKRHILDDYALEYMVDCKRNFEINYVLNNHIDDPDRCWKEINDTNRTKAVTSMLQTLAKSLRIKFLKK